VGFFEVSTQTKAEIVRLEWGDMMGQEDCNDDRANRDQPGDFDGKPIIRGTRITVELILRKLAEGASEGEMLEDYPHLTKEDIPAAVAYGAASVAHEEVVLLPDAPIPGKS
jgi:uncharacterized protein (DUF433 family)